MVPSLTAAEPVTHRNHYSIQVMSGAPEAVKNAWQKVDDLPFARIEKHAGQHKLRIGFWSRKDEAENQLAGIKSHFPGAFVFVTEYKPNEILLEWPMDAASPPGKPASTGEQPIAVASELVKPLPAGSEGKQELLNTVSAAMAPGPRVLALAGAETNPGNSAAYAGIVMPLHSRLGRLGNGMVQRLWADHLTYSYDSNGQNIRAEQLGIEGSLGYQKSGPWGSWATFLGTVYRDTQLSPDDPGNRARGGKFHGRIQLEGERILSRDWRANIIASYVTGQNSYWARGRLLHNLSERMRAGPEVVTLGDPNFQIMQYGWAMMGLRVLSGADVTLRGGARKAQDGTTMYLGLELFRPF